MVCTYNAVCIGSRSGCAYFDVASSIPQFKTSFPVLFAMNKGCIDQVSFVTQDSTPSARYSVNCLVIQTRHGIDLAYSSFMKFVELVAIRNPLQKKAMRSFLSVQNEEFWSSAEVFAQGLIEVLADKGIDPSYVADSYVKMCRDMLTQQVVFKRTGSYSCAHSVDAYDNVYSSEAEMSSYMYGLALSQFLWPNHYAIYRFFQDVCSRTTSVRKYLEIGPGHGLFLIEALRRLPDARFTAIDISPVSLRISQEFVEHFAKGRKCAFRVQDVRDIDAESYDFITMCEVLEHLDETMPVLRKLYRMTAPGGRVFITTCANCPAIDHTYLYDSVGHIRRELNEAGFVILQDLPLAVGDLPEHLWEARREEVNYAAWLARAEDMDSA